MNFISKLKSKISYKTPQKFAQYLYFTIANFISNNLGESAAACSYGFIISFIPICLIIVSVLAGLLRFYPSIYNYIIELAKQIAPSYNIEPVIQNVMKIGRLSILDIFLGIWILWMARKLTQSTIKALNDIFRTRTKRSGFWNNILIFISEIILVLTVAVLIIATFIFDKFVHLPMFNSLRMLYPIVSKQSSNVILSLVFYLILFVCVFLAYRFLTGSKPKKRLCFFYGSIVILSFFGISRFINAFINVKNYNFLYGTLSTVMIMTMKVLIFFTVFLFGAQMMYVSQYFTALLRAEVYLLPDYEDSKISSTICRCLFINSDGIKKTENTIYVHSGDKLYNKGETAEHVYYLCKGFMYATDENSSILIKPGNFFGEAECLLHQKRQRDMIAETQCEVMFWSIDEFNELIHENPEAARKAIKKITSFSYGLYQ